MAGHSKWANIKHRKGAQDKKRGKIFTRCIKEITMAAKEGGVDPDMNPRLRLAVQNAKGQNVPKDTIERAIKKVAGGEGENYSELTYEGYGPQGIAIFVEATTDNTNRTVANVRSYFTKNGGNLGTNGSLEFLFERKGFFTIPKGELDMEELEMELIDFGLEELEALDDDKLLITTGFEDFAGMGKQLEEMNIEAESAELQRVPNDTKTLDAEAAKGVLKLLDKLEEDDDVQNVYHTMELTDEIVALM